MNLKLKIWRQDTTDGSGQFKDYEIRDVSPDSSFLEMLDMLNEQLVETGDQAVAFDSDCREGVCGMCSLTINGIPHGGHLGTSTSGWCETLNGPRGLFKAYSPWCRRESLRKWR